MKRSVLANKTREELIEIIMDFDDQMEKVSLSHDDFSSLTNEKEKNKKLIKAFCMESVILITMMIACLILAIKYRL